MKNLLYKIKTRTLAIGFVVVVGGYFAGKKLYKNITDYGKELEPLTDDEIRDTLGIGAGDEYTIE